MGFLSGARSIVLYGHSDNPFATSMAAGIYIWIYASPIPYGNPFIYSESEMSYDQNACEL
jgi:hypothetical protein